MPNAPSAPGRYQIRKRIGDDWSRVLTFPLDLTGWAVLAQVRSSPLADPPIATITATIGTAVTVGSGYATPITLTLGKSDVPVGRYVWELQLTDPGGDVGTWLAGGVDVSQDVAR